jgi:hypothetical protein
VLDQVARYTGHVRGFPCEHTYVVPQKPNERVFLFRIQIGPDKCRLDGIAVDQLDLLVILGLDALARGLQLWDLQVVSESLGGGDQGLLHADREVHGFGHFETFFFIGVGHVDIASEGEDAVLGRHLDTTTVYKDPLEPDAIDAGIKHEGKLARFRNYGPPFFTVEGDFSVRPSWKPRVGDEVVGIVNTHASLFE